MFVCGARGKGKETDIGEPEALPFARPGFPIPLSRVAAMLGSCRGCTGGGNAEEQLVREVGADLADLTLWRIESQHSQFAHELRSNIRCRHIKSVLCSRIYLTD